MALHDFLADLDALLAEATAAFAAAGDDKALEDARIHFIGHASGKLKAVQKGLGQVDKPDKPAAGKRFNEVKQQIQAAFDAARERLKIPAFDPSTGSWLSQSPDPVQLRSRRGPSGVTTWEPLLPLSAFDPTVPGVHRFGWAGCIR